MAFSVSRFSTFSTISLHILKHSPSIQLPLVRYSKFRDEDYRNTRVEYKLQRCYAHAKEKRGGVSPATKDRKKPSSRNTGKNLREDDFVIEKSGGVGGGGVEVLESQSQSGYGSLPLPKPPAGFVLDDHGRVLMASNKRIVTIVDSTNNHPLECVIRRIFRNSCGDACMLVCPVDMPVQILKSVNVEGWSAVSDEEVEALLPTAAYALTKIHMHLVHSGFCYTARGGFCYAEKDVFEVHLDSGEDVDDLPTEGIEIACFHLDGSHYMIYTPSDPLLFVAVKDKNGTLQIADDELLDDLAVVGAIDEETEFNALVEEEAALLDSLLGKS
ncbi:hypothetical protein F511_22556 [Dorcoceras hygrometricum]|uniref:Uncharacterized protein n=1 Tax=Dorcoceras hygrometricum TaxID=472368 RepID=A0A2Z7CZ32_9LAMI|nr:hypothetical protein F511_22556 [Dorcoceras hygrometricum]